MNLITPCGIGNYLFNVFDHLILLLDIPLRSGLQIQFGYLFNVKAFHKVQLFDLLDHKFDIFYVQFPPFKGFLIAVDHPISFRLRQVVG